MSIGHFRKRPKAKQASWYLSRTLIEPIELLYHRQNLNRLNSVKKIAPGYCGREPPKRIDIDTHEATAASANFDVVDAMEIMAGQGGRKEGGISRP